MAPIILLRTNSEQPYRSSSENALLSIIAYLQQGHRLHTLDVASRFIYDKRAAITNSCPSTSAGSELMSRWLLCEPGQCLFDGLCQLEHVSPLHNIALHNYRDVIFPLPVHVKRCGWHTPLQWYVRSVGVNFQWREYPWDISILKCKLTVQVGFSPALGTCMTEALSMPWQIRTALIKQLHMTEPWRDNYWIPYLSLLVFHKKYARLVSNTLKVSSFHHRLSPELLSVLNNDILKQYLKQEYFFRTKTSRKAVCDENKT